MHLLACGQVMSACQVQTWRVLVSNIKRASVLSIRNFPNPIIGDLSNRKNCFVRGRFGKTLAGGRMGLEH